jgi:hypothetical protein
MSAAAPALYENPLAKLIRTNDKGHHTNGSAGVHLPGHLYWSGHECLYGHCCVYRCHQVPGERLAWDSREQARCEERECGGCGGGQGWGHLWTRGPWRQMVAVIFA